MLRYGTSLDIHFRHDLTSKSRVAHVNRTKSLKNTFNECVQSMFLHDTSKIFTTSTNQNTQFIQGC
jgi:hypothetical protein